MTNGQTITVSGEIDHISDATPGDLIVTVSQVAHAVFTRKGHDLAVECVISLKESVCGFDRMVTHLDGRRVRFCNPFVNGDDDDEVCSRTTDEEEEAADVVGTSTSHSNTTGGGTNKTPTIIQTGDIHVLKGEGMPKQHSTVNHVHDDEINNHADDDDEAYVAQRCQQYGDLYVQYKVELPTPKSTTTTNNTGRRQSIPSPVTQQKMEDNLSNAERIQLGTLLDKLEGITKTTTASKPQSDDDTDNSMRGGKREGIRSLSLASAADFGHASGPIEMQDDGEEHLQRRRSRRGFQQRSHTQFFSSMGGASPFSGAGGAGASTDDDGEVQCQQM